MTTTTTATTQREAALERAATWQAMTSKIKEVVIERLDLPIPPEWLSDDQPLFGRGLELDSIDALELTMAIDQEFGTPVYEDDTSIFGSVSAFLTYLLSERQELTPEAAERLRAALAVKAGFVPEPQSLQQKETDAS